MKKFLLGVVALFGLHGELSAQTPFFQDNFDKGTRTNANGFVWRDATAVIVSDSNKFSGTHSLRFNFGARPVGKDSWAEQRFNMGRYLNEVWIEYMLFVPENFKHRNDPSSDNNKFIMLWRDKYSDAVGGTQQLGMEYDPTVPAGVEGLTSAIRPMGRPSPIDTATKMLITTLREFRAGNRGPDGNRIQPIVAIGPNRPIATGKWTRIRFHFKLSSARLKNDGVYQMWANDSLLVNAQNQAFWNTKTIPTDASFRKGYLLGWANSGFTERTLMYIDDVKFYDTNPGWK